MGIVGLGASGGRGGGPLHRLVPCRFRLARDHTGAGASKVGFALAHHLGFMLDVILGVRRRQELAKVAFFAGEDRIIRARRIVSREASPPFTLPFGALAKSG
jgi:hypothetical protein